MIIRNNVRTLQVGFNGCDATFSIDAWRQRIEVSDRFGKRGVGIGGDEEPQKRYAIFSWDVKTETDQAFFSYVNDFVEFFRPINGPFFLEDSANNRRAEVRLDSFKPKFKEGLEYRLHNVEMKLILIDSAWESLSENSTTQTAINSGTSFSVSNSGFLDSYPIIELTAITPNPEVTIRNQTTGASATIQTSAFTTGKIMFIDNIKGKVSIDGINITTALSAGGFWFLAKGNNSIVYESPHGPVDLVLRFREAYPF